MPTTTATRTVVRGQDFTWTFTLEGSGTIASSTNVANVRRRGTRQVLLSGVALAILDAVNRQVTLALTPAQTLLLVGDPDDPTHEIEHVLDVKHTASGTALVTPFGPLVFNVRTQA